MSFWLPLNRAWTGKSRKYIRGFNLQKYVGYISCPCIGACLRLYINIGPIDDFLNRKPKFLLIKPHYFQAFKYFCAPQLQFKNAHNSYINHLLGFGRLPGHGISSVSSPGQGRPLNPLSDDGGGLSHWRVLVLPFSVHAGGQSLHELHCPHSTFTKK